LRDYKNTAVSGKQSCAPWAMIFFIQVEYYRSKHVP